MAKRIEEEEAIEHPDEMREVQLPSEAPFFVHEKEEKYFKERVTRYLEDNSFSNVSDLQDMDRVMIGEMLIYRWGQWLMQGKDYWGVPIIDIDLQKQIKELSAELRQVKATLSLDKVSRDRQRGEDSVNAYLGHLRTRAMHFGFKRNEELQKALEILHKTFSLITLYDNCNETERRERKVELEHIIQWLRDTARPEFNEIDRKFRQDGPDAQKLWIQLQ